MIISEEHEIGVEVTSLDVVWRNYSSHCWRHERHGFHLQERNSNWNCNAQRDAPEESSTC